MQTFTLQTQKTRFHFFKWCFFSFYPTFTVSLFMFIKIQTSFSTTVSLLINKNTFLTKKRKIWKHKHSKKKKKSLPILVTHRVFCKKRWYKMFRKSFNPTSKRTKTWNSTLRTPIWQMCTWIFLIEAKKKDNNDDDGIRSSSTITEKSWKKQSKDVMEIGMRENGKHLQKHLAFSRNKFLSLFIHPSTYTTANRPPTLNFLQWMLWTIRRWKKWVAISFIYRVYILDIVMYFLHFPYNNRRFPSLLDPNICMYYIKKKLYLFFSLFHHHLRSLGKKIHYIL